MNKQRASYIEGTVSIIGNTGLFALKLWAGLVSCSIALTADAWHTLSDSISSLIVIVGAKLASKSPDQKHPFGYGRWEYITAIFIGFLLGIIAYNFVQDAYQNLKSKQTANFGLLAIVVTIISILSKEAMAQYAFYIYRKSGNIAVRADGWHHRTDALSSIVILIGIFFTDYFWWMDSVLGFLVALFLLYAAYGIIKEAIEKLLGEKPEEELIEKIKTIISEVHHEDLIPHHFHVHNYVNHQELTFHIKLDKTQSIEYGHDIATKLEKRLKKDLEITTTIHVEPIDVKHLNR